MFDPIVVPGRPATDGMTWSALAEVEGLPGLALAPDPPGAVTIAIHTLKDFGDGAKAFLIATTGLQPDTLYTLTITDDRGRQELAFGRTLPPSLASGRPFTIAVGSCFNWPMDLEEINRSVPPKRHGMDTADPVRLTFLVGDQIYMDLKKHIDHHRPDSWSEPLATAPDPWAAYRQQWVDRRYRNFFVRGSPFLFLADDHELWNDYPHKPIWLPWTKGADGDRLATQLRNAFDVFQAALNLPPTTVSSHTSIPHTLIRAEGHSFSFDLAPLSFFVLDTRLGRTRTDTRATPRFTEPAHMGALQSWLARERGMGVLVLAPPVFQGKGSVFDHNLADYDDDYAALVESLNTTPSPVIILAGDIHYSRLYALQLSSAPADPPEAMEFVCSPLSRLKPPPGVDPPSGEDVIEGRLGASGAVFRLETPSGPAGAPSHFLSTERQSYGTLTFTVSPSGGDLEVVFRLWGPRERRRDGAVLLLEKVRTWELGS